MTRRDWLCGVVVGPVMDALGVRLNYSVPLRAPRPTFDMAEINAITLAHFRQVVLDDHLRTAPLLAHLRARSLRYIEGRT